MSGQSVISYTPDPSRHDPRWCREGLAISNADGVFLDTYWSTMGEAHVVTPQELATSQHLFSLDEYEELNLRGARDKWLTYAEGDRQRITSQHGLEVRYFIRKGAHPDLATQVQNAREALRAAVEEERMARRRREWCEERLDDLLDQMEAAR